MLITDDNAFTVLQEVLAGRLQVEPDARASKVLRLLAGGDSDCVITQERFRSWRRTANGRTRGDFVRSTAPAVLSVLMWRADVTAIAGPTLIRIPFGSFADIGSGSWSSDAKAVWVVPGPDRVVLKIRAGSSAWTEPSATTAPEGGALEPRDLEPFVPEERAFDAVHGCPHCRSTTASYRIYDRCCVCQACGRSFDRTAGSGG